MENLELYNKFRKVPEEAQKPISAGRLKGMTDINPMWRIKALTSEFGPCGIGWKVELVRTWIEQGNGGELVANVEINLYIKVDGTWSDGIPGIGGSRLVSKESSGLYTDDECYKKAYTDALSVACKLLGVGADVYWNKDSSKYDTSSGVERKPCKDYQSAPRALKAPTNDEVKSQTKSKYTRISELIKSSANLTLSDVNTWISKKFGKNVILTRC